MTLQGYVEPEVKMQDERQMYSQFRSFMYGEGVLARSAIFSQSGLQTRSQKAEICHNGYC